MKKIGKQTLLALFVSQALILSIVESWIPIPVGIPGVKLGLANIVTVLVILSLGYRAAFTVVIIRCILGSFFGGGLIMFLFSIAGGILSTSIMTLLYKYFSKYFSILGISVAGSIAHNIGQITIACIIMKEIMVATYLPVLLVSGVIMGCFVGFCSSFLWDALRKTGILPKREVV